MNVERVPLHHVQRDVVPCVADAHERSSPITERRYAPAKGQHGFWHLRSDDVVQDSQRPPVRRMRLRQIGLQQLVVSLRRHD